MRYAAVIAWIAGVLALLMLLQFGRLFAWSGVAPNFALAFLFVLGIVRAPLPVFGAALAGFALFSFLWAPFWMGEAAAAAGVALAGYLLARYLTGNRWIDMALLAGGGTLLLTALGAYVFGFAAFSWSVFGETAYTISAGLLLLALFPRRGKPLLI
ncbi:MAG: hypothetical protein V1656_02615 [Candidatus Jorgensenbacteria bacterium]